MIMSAVFTFHDVSINTENELLNGTTDKALHSTMFLLILRGTVPSKRTASLHSTMFLLIQIEVLKLIKLNNFTFHDVSINTCDQQGITQKS